MIQFFKDLFKYTKRVYFTKALDFRSRASRKEYRYALILILALPVIIFAMIGALTLDPLFFGLIVIATPSLFLAVCLLALLYLTLLFTSTMRRLNDSNIPYSISLTLMIAFVAVVVAVFFYIFSVGLNPKIFFGLIALLIFLLLILVYCITRPSTPGENKYGPQPED